ncbi:hypothetical protein CERSUDRAFT_116425 [Gelatoporia subvermispora B]|uniref:Uncharacterized protein n=1 Tax=Ceriporiopsis subvermispora (strain B) TaxID=914234 RepID=M2RA76_CERS8|nr:hypothetical protein CERSUDRAFT_116425 [Gelatoporia subvermispora B]
MAPLPMFRILFFPALTRVQKQSKVAPSLTSAPARMLSEQCASGRFASDDLRVIGHAAQHLSRSVGKTHLNLVRHAQVTSSTE